MAVVTLTDSEACLRDLIGGTVLLGARSLVGTGAVETSRWDPDAGAADSSQFVGVVRDGQGRHETRGRVRHSSGGRLTALEGWCSCGLAVPCRHSAAVVLTLPPPPVTTAPVTTAPVTTAPVGAWATALEAALSDRTPQRAVQARVPDQRPETAGQPPLGLQFEVAPPAAGGITLRLVLPGRSGGWVRSGISWAALSFPEYHLWKVPRGQVRLLQELYALAPTDRYGYRAPVVRLDTMGSRRVWDLLLEVQEQGVPLVVAGRRGESVRVLATPAVARFDVRREGGELVGRPVLQVAGEVLHEAQPMGEPAHGVAWRHPADGGLTLARLAAPPDPSFSILSGSIPKGTGTLRIPAVDEAVFLRDYLPRLAHRVEVVSSDGSVELPTARPPLLEVTVSRLALHRLQLDLAWAYAVGSAVTRAPLAPAGWRERQRDADAEGRILADLAPVLGTLPGWTRAAAGDPAVPPRWQLDGIDAARWMAEALPVLQDHPDVEIRLVSDGPVPDYRDAEAPPEIEFAAGSGESGPGFGDQDWLDLAVRVTVDGHDVPFDRLIVALAQDQSHLLLDNGVYFTLDRPEFAALAQLLAESREMLDAPAGTVRLSRFHASAWEEVERLGVVTGQVESWREAVRSLLSPAQAPAVLPTGLKATLRPYQADGFAWLAMLYAHGLGGVLADDMGLGKTLQTLALLAHVRQDGADGPFLVVAPTSVVGNWASEAARFTPDLVVAAVTQTQARRGTDLATAVAGADVVVTSYTLFRLEFEQYRDRPWAGLVLDEAQNVKNLHAAGYRCARELPARFKLAITGTPMENNLMELWALLSITAPGLFARPERFTEYYRTPIERSQDVERLAQLRRRIRPVLLRRTKDQVASDLPDRQEQVIELDLHPRQRAIYSRYLQRERQKVLGLLGDLNRNRFEILRSLTILRQASLDVSLVDPAHESVPSTKLDAVVEQLQGIVGEGHRVLVFSQFTRFLGRLRDRLDTIGVDHCYLDGKTRGRAGVISRFRTGDAPVFLISLKAGGVGLNLTEADYVILLDPWWNPATEAQAVDRAHRIGQTRNVMVYRLVAKDTIEDKVMALKERKAALTASVLNGDEFASAQLTAQDIRALLD